MTTRGRNLWFALLAVASLGFAAWLGIFMASGTALASSDGSITGVVTDDAGKPLRGAVVTATIKDPTATVKEMGISRWSDASGKYQITGLKPGNYSISATAYAYAPASRVDKEISNGGTTNVTFSLKPQWNVTRISTSEYISAFGGANDSDKDMRNLEQTCTGCHNFSWIMRRRGMTADEWSSFIPNMPNNRMITPFHDTTDNPPSITPEKLKDIGVSLAKHFGPDSPLPTQEQVHHVPISDEALNQTMTIYTPPTPSLDHSLTVGADGRVWFGEYSTDANKVGMFDPAKQEFKEYPVPTPGAGPHNFWVARDGMVWFGEAYAHKLASLDPETGKISEYPVPNGAGSSMVVEGPTGDIWMALSGARNSDVSRFNPSTKKFDFYPDTGGYGIAVDSQNNCWSADTPKGALASIDPQTGKITRYPIPGVQGFSLRGVAVDAQDNVWFAVIQSDGPGGHSLGRLDHKTKQMTFYRPPTANFSAYGVVVDKKTGDIWTDDYLGSSVDRFDPATGKWTVFPFPSATQMARFFGEGPQGQIWTTDFGSGRIVELNTGESTTSARQR